MHGKRKIFLWSSPLLSLSLSFLLLLLLPLLPLQQTTWPFEYNSVLRQFGVNPPWGLGINEHRGVGGWNEKIACRAAVLVWGEGHNQFSTVAVLKISQINCTCWDEFIFSYFLGLNREKKRAWSVKHTDHKFLEKLHSSKISVIVGGCCGLPWDLYL